MPGPRPGLSGVLFFIFLLACCFEPFYTVRMKNASRIGAGAILALTLLAGCMDSGTTARLQLRDPVMLLLPPDPGRETRAVQTVLQNMYTNLTSGSMDRLNEAFTTARKQNRVLVIPEIKEFPPSFSDALLDFIERGGKPFFLGLDPFESGWNRSDTPPSSLAQRMQNVSQAAQDISEWSDVQVWEISTTSENAQGISRLRPKQNAIPWPGVTIRIDQFQHKAQLVSPPFPVEAKNNQALFFYAKGSRNTSSLTIEALMHNRDRWAAVVPLADEWKLFSLSYDDFTALSRHAAKPIFDFSDLAELRIGLDGTLVALPEGPHSFGCSNIRLGQRHMRVLSKKLAFRIPGMIYRANRYEVTAFAVKISGGLLYEDLQEFRVQCPYPLPAGRGGEWAHPFRAASLSDIRNEQGVQIGSASTLLLSSGTDGSILHAVWAGLNPASIPASALQDLLKSGIDRLSRETFIMDAGCTQFSFAAHDPIKAAARWSTPSNVPVAPPLSAKIERKNGHPFRKTFPKNESAYGNMKYASLDFGSAPEPNQSTDDYVLHISLSPDTVYSRKWDAISQHLKVFSSGPASNALVQADVSGARITYGKRPVNMIGVEYAPQTLIPGQTEKSISFLDPAFFNPKRLRHDFDLLAGRGINAILLDVFQPSDVPQLRYVMDEAAKRNIRIMLRIRGCSVLGFDPVNTEQILKASGIANNAVVFSIDLLGPPPYDEQALLPETRQTDWANWLVEQFGSIAEAEKELSASLDESVSVIRRYCASPNTLRPAQEQIPALYRLFLHDWISRQTVWIKTILRSYGLNQLITLKSWTPYSAPDPPFAWIDPACAALHLDFISPCIAGIDEHPDGLDALSFLTAFARGAANQKPVIWMDAGVSMGPAPSPIERQAQQEYFHELFKLIGPTHAAGCFARQTPSAFDPPFATCSLFRPDGRWNPVEQVYRRNAREIQGFVHQPPPWRGRVVLPPVSPRSQKRLWEQWMPTYLSELQRGHFQELRLQGFRQQTTDILASSLSAELNNQIRAQWISVEIEGAPCLRKPGTAVAVKPGQTMDLTVMNTGSFSWASSRQGKHQTVWISIMHQGIYQKPIPVPDVHSGETYTFPWSPSTSGRWVIRPMIQGMEQFGEKLVVDASP